MNQKGNALIYFLVGIFVTAVAGGTFYLGRQTTPKPSVVPAVTSQTPQPTAISQPTQIPDETANWKTYASKVLSFKYPATLTLEERQTNYIVLLSDPNPQSVLVSIDARQSDNYADYDKAVSSTKAHLTNIQT